MRSTAIPRSARLGAGLRRPPVRRLTAGRVRTHLSQRVGRSGGRGLAGARPTPTALPLRPVLARVRRLRVLPRNVIPYVKH